MTRPDLERLNPQQRTAVQFGLSDARARADDSVEAPGSIPPLLIIAGAGTGKTLTLAHRVAELVLEGLDPRRILLLTFTRRAAAEMTRRAEHIVAQARTRAAGAVPGGRGLRSELRWAGTFHAVGNRLLRRFGPAIGLDSSFTILDRGDAEDLLHVVRTEQGLSARERRFPQKATCLAVYSRCVNSGEPLRDALRDHFPWCAGWEDELRGLFRGYVEEKQRRAVLDYDDLLLYWFHLMQEPDLATRVAARFDHVLVDEYQDTNALQASILMALRPDGTGITVVGDDAQSIYAFRAATVRNILDFPSQFDPPAEIVTLEQNYRSTQTILDAANAVIGFARERYTKNLVSARASNQRPWLVTVEDESEQAGYVATCILEARESGIPLIRQGVLFRTSHHSDLLEVELSRRDIPFVKFGGLRFIEAAHVKDLLAILRWAENPRDAVAAYRVLQLLPGIGPALARRAFETVEGEGGSLPALRGFRPPASAGADWPGFVELMEGLAGGDRVWPDEVGDARRWYEPWLERRYDSAVTRIGDLEQLEIIAAQYADRQRFLAELTLDPPGASGDLARDPHLDEDYLVLSTIHSAKGQEWDVVHVLNVVDGCIPSDMATSSAEEIEEERRLLYVAMTRAREQLHLIHPLRFYVIHQPRHGDRHVYAPLSRFLPASIRDRFEVRLWAGDSDDPDGGDLFSGRAVDVARRLRDMW